MKQNKIIAVGMLITLAGLSKLLPVSYVIGSYKMYFSGISMFLPAIGGFLSGIPALGLVGLFFGCRVLFKIGSITFGLPSMMAAFNWSVSNKKSLKNSVLSFLVQVVLPLACITAFLLHPVAGNAPLYATYWLIPVALFIAHQRGYQSTFSIALSSSFIAHAVGGMFWLALVPMTAAQWTALIPMVAIERLTFAAGSVVAYKGVKQVSNYLVSSFSNYSTKQLAQASECECPLSKK